MMENRVISQKLIEYLDRLKNAKPLQEKLIKSLASGITSESSDIEAMYWSNVFVTPMEHVFNHTRCLCENELKEKVLDYLRQGVDAYERIITTIRLKLNTLTSTYSALQPSTSSERLYLECASRTFAYMGNLYSYILKMKPYEETFTAARDCYTLAFIMDPSNDFPFNGLSNLYTYVGDSFSALFYSFKGVYGVSISTCCKTSFNNLLSEFVLNIPKHGTIVDVMKYNLFFLIKQLFDNNTLSIPASSYEKLQKSIIDVIDTNIGDTSNDIQCHFSNENNSLVLVQPLDTQMAFVFTTLLIIMDSLRKIDSTKFQDVFKMYISIFLHLLELLENYLTHIFNSCENKESDKNVLEVSTNHSDPALKSHDSTVSIRNHENLNETNSDKNDGKKESSSLSSIFSDCCSLENDNIVSSCESEEELPTPIRIKFNYSEQEKENSKESKLDAENDLLATGPTTNKYEFKFCFLKVVKLTIDWLRCWPEAIELVSDILGVSLIDSIKRVFSLIPEIDERELESLAKKEHLFPEDLLILGHPLFSRLHKNLNYKFESCLSLKTLHENEDLHRVAYLKKVIKTARLFTNRGNKEKDTYNSKRGDRIHPKRRSNWRKKNGGSHYSPKKHDYRDTELSGNLERVNINDKVVFKLNGSDRESFLLDSKRLTSHRWLIPRTTAVLAYSALLQQSLIKNLILGKKYRLFVPFVVVNRMDDLKTRDPEARKALRYLNENCYPRFICFRIQSYEESILLRKSKRPANCSNDVNKYMDAVFQTALIRSQKNEPDESTVIVMSNQEYVENFGNDDDQNLTDQQDVDRKYLLEKFRLKGICVVTIEKLQQEILNS